APRGAGASGDAGCHAPRRRIPRAPRRAGSRTPARRRTCRSARRRSGTGAPPPRSRGSTSAARPGHRRSDRRSPAVPARGPKPRGGGAKRTCGDGTPSLVTLPYLTSSLAGVGGTLRTTDDDFVVDEELPYAPPGAGDHVFVRIEKRGSTSLDAARALARALGIRDRDIGIAGMKDRRAVTRQWMSLPPPVTPEQALAVALPDLRVLEAHRHPHKLRTGHVRANRFVLRVRGVAAGAAERARAVLAALAQAPGAPNWYGEQRFGRDGDNAARGMALVTGAHARGRDRRMDRLMVSALQSQLFNNWLVARIADG